MIARFARCCSPFLFLAACAHSSTGSAPATRPWDALIRVYVDGAGNERPIQLQDGLRADTAYQFLVQLHQESFVYVGQIAQNGAFSVLYSQSGNSRQSLNFPVGMSADRARLCVLVSTTAVDSWNGSGCDQNTPIDSDEVCTDKGGSDQSGKDKDKKGTESGTVKGASNGTGPTKGGCTQPVFRGRIQDGRMLLALPVKSQT